MVPLTGSEIPGSGFHFRAASPHPVVFFKGGVSLCPRQLAGFGDVWGEVVGVMIRGLIGLLLSV